MRPTKNQRKANAGELQVSADFAHIGWEPLASGIDYGTDRYVVALDELGNQIGLVGVQAKAVETPFKSPKRDERGKVEGWWWRDKDSRHFDHWTSHSMPHLLVLYKKDERISYWVHISPCRVVSTGKGRKIFVPADQKINEENRGRLEAIASKSSVAPGRHASTYAWDGNIPEDRRLQFALVAPWLVAPHPAEGHSTPIDAMQGLALLAQGRFPDLKSFSEEHHAVPDPEEELLGNDWMWHFARAIWDWATRDSCESLRKVVESAPEKNQRAASGVFLACALRRAERFDDALNLLEALADAEDLEPTDFGWVLLHRARARAEAGDSNGSLSDGIRAQRCLEGTGDDPVVATLRSCAAWQVFATEPLATTEDEASEPEAGDSRTLTDRFAERFKQLVIAENTPVSMWRSQTVAQALGSVTDEYFESWAEYQPDRLFSASSGATARKLFSAELSADISGNHGAWKAMSSLAGRHRIAKSSESTDEIGEVVEGLDALRRSGNSRHIEIALTRLRRRGPTDSMTKTVRKIPPPSRWTHTTAGGNLSTLGLAGDLLDEPRAGELVVEVTRIACLADLEFIERTRPTFAVGHYGLKAVSRMLSAAPTHAHTEVVSTITAQKDQISDHPAFDFDGIFTQIELSAAHPSDRDTLWHHCLSSDGRLGTAVLGWFVRSGRAEARSKAVERAGNGDQRSFEALGDIAALDKDQAGRLIATLEVWVEEQLASERSTKKSMGGFLAIEYLALLNLRFKQVARWDLLVEILIDPLVDAVHKRHACAHMVAMSDKIPSDVRDSLAIEIDAINATTTVWGESTKLGGMGTALAISIGEMDEDTAYLEAARLSLGTPQQRSDAAWLLGLGYCPDLQPVLAALLNDEHHYVRSTAAGAIGRLLITEQTSMIRELARKVANSDGMLLPSALLNGMRNGDAQLSPIMIELTTSLQDHASAQIRHYAHRLLQQKTTG